MESSGFLTRGLHRPVRAAFRKQRIQQMVDADSNESCGFDNRGLGAPLTGAASRRPKEPVSIRPVLELFPDGRAPVVLADGLAMGNAMQTSPDGLHYYRHMMTDEVHRVAPDGGPAELFAEDLHLRSGALRPRRRTRGPVPGRERPGDLDPCRRHPIGRRQRRGGARQRRFRRQPDVCVELCRRGSHRGDRRGPPTPDRGAGVRRLVRR